MPKGLSQYIVNISSLLVWILWKVILQNILNKISNDILGLDVMAWTMVH